MLDKILNINPQDKYKSGVKIATLPYAVNKNENERQSSKDTALFSPLAKLLSKINWKILNIEYPSDDEILFNFLVNDLEFIAVINFNELYENPYQEFTIFKFDEGKGKKFRKELKLNVKKEKISILNKSTPILTDYISLIFDRLEVEKNQNYTSTDLIYLKSLVFGIEEKVRDELSYLLKVVYTFIYTRFKARIKNNYILKTQENIPIMMQKVAIIYAE